MNTELKKGIAKVKAFAQRKHPLCTVDGIIQVYAEKDRNKKFQGIVLIERLNYPHGFALPGGFVEYGETVEHACKREMKEETGLDVKIEKLNGVYSNPTRDPRWHVIGISFICSATGKPKAQSDAKKVHVFPLNKLPKKMCFDHKQILKSAIKKIY